MVIDFNCKCLSPEFLLVIGDKTKFLAKSLYHITLSGRNHTAEILRGISEGLRMKGFRLATVGEMPKE